MNVTIDIGQPYSVEVLEKYAGTEHEREAVGMVLRRASDHLYHHITPDAPCDDFAAVDLLDDLRAELGVHFFSVLPTHNVNPNHQVSA